MPGSGSKNLIRFHRPVFDREHGNPKGGQTRPCSTDSFQPAASSFPLPTESEPRVPEPPSPQLLAATPPEEIMGADSSEPACILQALWNLEPTLRDGKIQRSVLAGGTICAD